MTDFSKNAQCVLRILESKESLTTTEILELAKSPEYEDICQDCAGGDTFVVAANMLTQKGLIKRQFGKGGYRWQIVRG